jgi:tRNA pseudouridine32 synthase/23S rRNA pseudouridine746 synthase
MLARRWSVPGFAPPVFDEREIAPFWSTGDAEISALSARIETLAGPERAQLERRRADCSRVLYDRLLATYRLPDRRGRERQLTELFAPARPPAGAGDCAAPKLLAHAQRHGLRALALAELWWGKATAERWHGSFHPPCHRCTPILAHMLSG